GTTASRPTRSRGTPAGAGPAWTKPSAAPCAAASRRRSSCFGLVLSFGLAGAGIRFVGFRGSQVALAVAGECDDAVLVVEPGEDHAHRIPALGRNLGNR